MNMTQYDFFNLLFDVNEATCFTNEPTGTTVFPVLHPHGTNFFCINPLLLERDCNPSQPWHSRQKGRRADCNVIVLRNILCEFDSGTIEEQQAIIDSMPHSTIVFSGGKSLHAIISLAEPCTDLRSYKELCKMVYAKLPTVDKSASNPSRLSRTPGAFRNGVEQQLLYVGKRISREELHEWLGPQSVANEPGASLTCEGWRRILNPWTKTYLAFGAEPGTRNATLFRAACDMLRAGYDASEILERVTPVADLPEHEVWTCIASATAAVNASSTQYGTNFNSDESS